MCYRFEAVQFDSLSLSLGLAELRQGQLVEAGKNYVIQREHLQHPPPFIAQSDLTILKQLVEADPLWHQTDEGYLPLTCYEPLLTEILATGRCFIRLSDGSWQKLVCGENISVQLNWILKSDGHYQLSWQQVSPCETAMMLLSVDRSLTAAIAYSESSNRLHLTSHPYRPEAIKLLNHICQKIPAAEVEKFLADHQSQWDKLALPLPTLLPITECPAEISPVLLFQSVKNQQLSPTREEQVSLAFRYEGDNFCQWIGYDADDYALDYWNGKNVRRFRRNREQEDKYLKQLSNTMSALENIRPGVWKTDTSEVWRHLLTEAREALINAGFQFLVEKGFKHHYVIANDWQVMARESGASHFELELLLGVEQDTLNLFALLDQLQEFNRHQSILTLSDGRMLLLPAEQVNGIMDELGDLLGQQSGTLQLPKNQLNRLESFDQQLPEKTQWKSGLEYLDLAKSLYQTPRLLEKIQKGVNATLRPYQWLGICWFQHLKRHGVSGLLADDMGLGKTLQTLVHLNLEQQQNQLTKPALIVAPTSLLHNWRAEIKKFTPNLSHMVIHGAKRHQQWKKIKDFDVLITSYQLVVKDLERWLQQDFSWIVLDEAQQIKNPRTQISQALKQLQSDNRLCLSGTPVENHLGELWSVLEFLMPGCLGSQKEFKHYYRKPIEKDADQKRMAQLQQRIAPFMLRRTKEQVATDLPAKTEIYQHIQLNDDQQFFYEQQKEFGQSEIEQQLEETTHGGQKQILLLTALLKLRQVCCDPALVGEPEISSSKREHCIDMLEELVAEGRAILVFSQFTSMLDLLGEDLDKLNIDYLKLTGQSQNRQKIVEAFQRGEAPVFLISLKAGGVGLNLTRADTVIHYDPWWNLAAEQQATDRAHRIGQDKPVFVYKLITENTIEEKIAQLQKYKAQISQHINHQAQLSGEQFALKLEDLMSLWKQEIKTT
ncbi:DEAD/DEAH box helicase [Aliikangiella coralliicola]|uniref:DEAD/DEAH box helicase n=1 Tax=Aliikangiella coralliicola TaxID=2592383 RepID=UPI00143D305E|nr:DEAD/DEAH box helicase [Aliikangiella coralliicola]